MKLKKALTSVIFVVLLIFFALPGNKVDAESADNEVALKVQIMVHKTDFINESSEFVTLDTFNKVSEVLGNFSLEDIHFYVTDENGITTEVAPKYAGDPNNPAWISLGNYALGSNLTLSVVPGTLPDKYHVLEIDVDYQPASITVRNNKVNLTIAQEKVAFLNEDDSIFYEEWIAQDNKLYVPDGPEKTDKLFKYWYAEAISDEKIVKKLQPGIKTGQVIDQYINYKPASINEPQRSYGYTTFKPYYVDAVNVTFFDADNQVYNVQQIEKGTTVQEITGPSKANQTFIRWVDEQGKPFDFTQLVEANLNLYPEYEERPTNDELAPPADSADNVRITFDPAGGIWADGSSEIISFDAEIGDEIIIPDGPNKAGASFLYWEGSRYYSGDQFTVTGPHTFTARYSDDTLINKPADGVQTIPTVISIESVGPHTENPASQEQPKPSVQSQVQSLPKTGQQSVISSPAMFCGLAVLGLAILLRKKMG